MVKNIAINGFGRIGRLVLRSLYESKREDIKVVLVNALGSVESNAHLFRYDSIHGRFSGKVSTGKDWMDVGIGRFKVTAERNPSKLPHQDLAVDIALECTGRFTKREEAARHIQAGAKKVLISAPSVDADITIVYGVNDHLLKSEHAIVSNASCTTNCLAPVAFVLNNVVGIERGYMTTVHSYTGDQPTIDTLHNDLQRARAAAQSIIPTCTGAAKTVSLVIPELEGKLDGSSLRVPIANVSLIDFKFVPKRDTNVEEISMAISEAANSSLRGIIGINSEPLVSADFNHNSHSSIFDLGQTKVIESKMVRVLSWYDNEWGFSNRMLDTAAVLAKTF
ncbi:glyceraldehyde-3-phosphate dehydrogenase, type I [Candidatus Endolissoclinum faulkneri L2]|uniref:Glyceraldehyde-3-phosphate dehydrogenase n=1 Tax=Candidatus Endolissoclinum faulkneri L2 TaxID=1193729 RepID=K7YPZ5_9PROT|nr:type I glyceraldehyde-3-phosphate dehydrogenase [Candidatus Endolissoclinum faulkneri]AFX99622.1 glyceraldehyde-3-phosphate dehydrogenase, type I [Candidatus Endolissoclinum faulkneri L2]